MADQRSPVELEVPEMTRLTASDINDDQLDALQDALDEIELIHVPAGDPKDYDYGKAPCLACEEDHPCETIQIISRQRSKMQENLCPTESTRL